MLRTARPVEAGRLQCQLTARRVRKEDDAILEEAMFPCTVCSAWMTSTLSQQSDNGFAWWCRVSSVKSTAEHIPHVGPTYRTHSSPINLRWSILFHIVAAIAIEAVAKK